MATSGLGLVLHSNICKTCALRSSSAGGKPQLTGGLAASVRCESGDGFAGVRNALKSEQLQMKKAIFVPEAVGTNERGIATSFSGIELEAIGSTVRAASGGHGLGGFVGVQGSAVAVRDIDASKTLTLDAIRENLIRQEDSIIFYLIERVQYKMNRATYDPQRIAIPGFDGSLLEYLLHETEHLHAKVRRYTSPAEHPFFPEALPAPIIGTIQYPKVLAPAADKININPRIWTMYFEDLLPAIVKEGDDGNYGSTACADLACLQALSKRIHYGKFVAEAKYLAAPGLYNALIEKQDGEGIMRLLTFESVEETVRRRVEQKAAIFGQDVTLENNESRSLQSLKLDPSLVARLYGEWVMPLTKEVQVQYLLRRLDHGPEA